MNTLDHFGVIKPDFVNGQKKLFIGGKWQDALSADSIESINPATGELLCTISSGGKSDIDLAVKAARIAFEGEWSRWTPHDRRKLLLRVHDVLQDNFDELALIETLDMGAPLKRVLGSKNWQSQMIQFYATQTAAGIGEVIPNNLPGHFSTTKIKAPVGVVAGIIPWNAPLMSQWWILGPTLATGCAAVLKPAEDASLTCLRIAELLQEAGVPDGVINVVTGYGNNAGAALSKHTDVNRLAFTGSVATARNIVHASAGNVKRLSLELGGKSPDIVFADADMDKAVPGAAMACYANSGQICAAGTRLFIQRSAQDEFVEKLTQFSQSLTVGNGLDSKVDLGPLINKKQLDQVMRYIELGTDEGATLATGGDRLGGDLSGGFFVQPTVFTAANNEMTIAREEIFGPVVTVIPFDTIEEALILANDTEFGLASGIWTQNLSTAHQMSEGIKAGTVWINCYGVIDPSVGFGGYKLSGYGWKGSKEHVDSFFYSKAVYMNFD